jgi:hypothetical protein
MVPGVGRHETLERGLRGVHVVNIYVQVRLEPRLCITRNLNCASKPNCGILSLCVGINQLEIVLIDTGCEQPVHKVILCGYTFRFI